MKNLVVLVAIIALFANATQAQRAIGMYKEFVPGTISFTTTNPTTIIGTSATGGSPDIEYSWEMSKDNGKTWELVVGQNKKDLESATKLVKGIYRRHDMNGCGDKYTNQVTIK